MNRIFKFRQWHPGFEDTGVKPHMEEPIEWLPSDRFSTWMQWTGLTDKNGKEIYEGDVVKGVVKYPQLLTWDTDENCNFPMAGSVFYDHSGFELKAIQSACDPKREGMANYFSFIGDEGQVFDDMEVIGNIYEDEHLLSNQGSRGKI